MLRAKFEMLILLKSGKIVTDKRQILTIIITWSLTRWKQKRKKKWRQQ